MRWTKKTEPTPALGTRRAVERFLWLPLTIGGETRWLERAMIEQEYGTWREYRQRGIDPPGGWIIEGWMNVAWREPVGVDFSDLKAELGTGHTQYPRPGFVCDACGKQFGPEFDRISLLNGGVVCGRCFEIGNAPRTAELIRGATHPTASTR